MQTPEAAETPEPAEIVLDVRTREVCTPDRSLVLQAQPFEVLRVLIDHAGEVVDREQLRRRLWPDGMFVDFEHGLNAAIKRLRAALGDDAARPRFIETIPRRGYRFIAPVTRAAGAAPASAPRLSHTVRLAMLPLGCTEAVREFTEGLAEELRTQFVRLSAGAVSVIARSTSTVLNGLRRRASDIGEALRAQYLLEGSVRTDGERARVTVCLVETSGETHVWSDVAECRLSAPLSEQIDLARRFAQSLARTLLQK